MKRICFTGNSHVGCMKLGIEAAREAGQLTGLDVTIFGSRGDKLKDATVENGTVRPNNAKVAEIFSWTSGGLDEITLADFDEVYVFAGLPPTCIDGFFARDPVTGIFDMPVMSDQLLARLFETLHKSWWITLAREIALDSPHVSVKFVGRPFKADCSPAAKRVLDLLASGDRAFAHRLNRVRAAIDDYCASSGLDNLTYVWPADALLEENRLYTKCEYTKGSQRLSEKVVHHPQDDFIHMNAAYGHAMVSHLLGLGAGTVSNTG